MWYDPILSYKSKLKINIICIMYGEKIPESTCKVAIYVSHDLVDFIRATVLLFKIYVLSSRERIFSINFFFRTLYMFSVLEKD